MADPLRLYHCCPISDGAAALAHRGARGPYEVRNWQQVGSRTTFKIDTNGKDYRYYMVWLRLPTSGGLATIDEVIAKT